MVRTRQGARADLSPTRDGHLVKTGDRGLEGDPLVDTTSFVPAVSVRSRQGESSGLRDEWGMPWLGILNGEGQGTQPPPTVALAVAPTAPPAIAHPPYPDPAYFA